jgi:hypothetical protein
MRVNTFSFISKSSNFDRYMREKKFFQQNDDDILQYLFVYVIDDS